MWATALHCHQLVGNTIHQSGGQSKSKYRVCLVIQCRFGKTPTVYHYIILSACKKCVLYKYSQCKNRWDLGGLME